VQIRYLMFLASSIFLFSACVNLPENYTTDTDLQENLSHSEAKKLKAFFADHFEAGLRLNPLRATGIGDSRFNDQLPNNLSPQSIKISRDFTLKSLQKIKQIDRSKLKGQDALSYDVFVYNSEQSIDGEQFPNELIPINQSFNIANYFAQLGSGESVQPFATVKDYQNWLKRLDGAMEIMGQISINMRQGVKQGVVQPRALMEKVLPQLEAHIVDDPKNSLFYKPIKNMPESFSTEEKQILTNAYNLAITTKIIPAYRNLHSYIQDEYMPHTRESFGLSELPNGQAWYDYRIKSYTTTNLTADEIHDFGLAEVARIRSEMEQVMRDVGFEGTLGDWFTYVKTNPEFYFDNEEDLLQAYRDLQTKVNKLLPKLFSIAPKTDYEVRAVEAFRAKSAAGASYQRGTPDGSRPGIFYVNTFNLKAQPKYGVETLSIHEAAPGHHFQISLQQEVEGLPEFRRFGGFTAFVEGWALYAESIGKEMGMFTDPMQYYGRLNSSMVDTDIVSEVERYIAWAGQALAYKIGQRTISNLRADAEKRLGDKFDVREFHKQVLIDGALPLEVLSSKINEWVESLL